MTYLEHYKKLFPKADMFDDETLYIDLCKVYGMENCPHYNPDSVNLGYCINCTNYYERDYGKTEMKSFTNADRIRCMTDEELVGLIRCTDDCYYCRAYDSCDGNSCECDRNVLNWLKQESEK